jgi:hypothetical protein
LKNQQTTVQTRRNFLEIIGLTSVGIIAGSSSSIAAGFSGHLPQDTAVINSCLQRTPAVALENATHDSEFKHSVRTLEKLIQTDGTVNKIVNNVHKTQDFWIKS